MTVDEKDAAAAEFNQIDDDDVSHRHLHHNQVHHRDGPPSDACDVKLLQGVPYARRLAFVDFDIECSCLPNSAGADVNLAEAAGQDGGTPKSKSTQPRSTSTWGHPVCKENECISGFT